MEAWWKFGKRNVASLVVAIFGRLRRETEVYIRSPFTLLRSYYVVIPSSRYLPGAPSFLSAQCRYRILYLPYCRMEQITIMTASSTGPGITAPTDTFAICAVYKSETNETKEDDTDSQDTQRDSARVSSDPWAFGGYVDADGRKMSVCTKSLLLVVSGLVMVVGAISAGIVADNNSAQANNDAGMSPQLIDDNMSTSILPSQPTLRPTQANAVASAPPTRDSAAVAINRALVERTARNITAKGFGDVDKLQLSMKQITFGAHTLFGYIGQVRCITIAFFFSDPGSMIYLKRISSIYLQQYILSAGIADAFDSPPVSNDPMVTEREIHCCFRKLIP